MGDSVHKLPCCHAHLNHWLELVRPSKVQQRRNVVLAQAGLTKNEHRAAGGVTSSRQDLHANAP